jgi:hypothetical protein
MNQLLKILKQIDKPGSFCSSSHIAPCFLGLEAKALGSIGLPLQPPQAKELIAHCQQAPFGRGEQTVVDTQVRRVWELEPTQFSITNPQWQQRLNDICSEVKDELGVVDDIVCEIYKLLVYEEGSFFLAHRDTEKLNRMFATLVVVLPSRHEGGELMIRHDGQEKCFAFGGENSDYEMRYAAFYADCQHEVRPVTADYRLCLIYNLALAKPAQQQPLAPNHSTVIDKLTVFLRDWAAREAQIQDDDQDENAPNKLAVLLTHHYSEAELNFQQLKNLDRVTARVLVEAAQAAQCQAHLALVTLWESGDAEGGGYYYDNDPDDYEMGEIYDSSLTVNYWLDVNGKHQELGEMQISEDQIIAEKALGDGKPDEEEVDGPTGNAGATMERWYHRAAVVIWASKDHFAILTHAGQRYAVPQLQAMLAEHADAASCRQFAQAIMDDWCWDNHNTLLAGDNTPPIASMHAMLSTLMQLGDSELLGEFFNGFLVTDFYGTEGQDIRRLCQQVGWTVFADALQVMSKQTDLIRLAAFSQILADLSENAAPTSPHYALCITLARNALDNLLTCNEPRNRLLDLNESWLELGLELKLELSSEQMKCSLVIHLFKTVSQLQQLAWLEQLGNDLNQTPAKFNLHSVVIPVIKALHAWLESQQISCAVFDNAFLQPCVQHIKQRATLKIDPPKNWVRQADVSCDCTDCHELVRFLGSPTEQQQRFRMRQDRRDHLESKIKTHQLDLDTNTERVGSPHTLVCTKNRASYDRAKQQQAIDIALWQELQQF